MKMNHTSFRGRLYKLRLIASDIAYGPCPAPDEEVEQRLTIMRNGMVWLSRWAFGCGIKPTLICREQFRIGDNAVTILFERMEAYFSGNLKMALASDADVWNLELTNTNKQVYYYIMLLLSSPGVLAQGLAASFPLRFAWHPDTLG